MGAEVRDDHRLDCNPNGRTDVSYARLCRVHRAPNTAKKIQARPRVCENRFRDGARSRHAPIGDTTQLAVPLIRQEFRLESKPFGQGLILV